MTRQLCVLTMSLALIGCNGGNADDTGTDDTAVEETGDTGDTDTGEPELCGNGTVDAGEQCDDGVDNGPDASCSDECDYNGWVTCDLLTGPIVAWAPTTTLGDGRYHIDGTFSGKVEIESSCVTDPEHNVAVQITIPANGSYLLSTDNAGTTAAITSISLRTDCDDRAELSCNNGNALTPGRSQAWIDSATAGDTFVALIELVEGAAPSNWQLSMQPIDGVANVGAACDFDTPCADGASCTGDVCVTSSAPTLTSVTMTQVAFSTYYVEVKGTDVNRDATTVRIPHATNDAAQEWGDSPSEKPWIVEAPYFGAPNWTWTGDDFVVTYTQRNSLLEWTGTLVDFDVDVLDATGLDSSDVTVTYGTPIGSSIVVTTVGGACDMCTNLVGDTSNCGNSASGYPTYCDANSPNELQCTFTDTEGAMECGAEADNVGPTITSATMTWFQGSPYLAVTGSDDAPGRITGDLKITLNDDSVRTAAPYWGGTGGLISWNADGTFTTLAAKFTPGDLSLGVKSVTIAGKDAVYPNVKTGAPFTFTWVDAPVPTEVAEGGICDFDLLQCAEGLLCSPDLAGDNRCATASAPVLMALDAWVVAGQFGDDLQGGLSAYDENADWTKLHRKGPSGQLQTLNVFSGTTSTWSPNPTGVRAYEGTVPLGGLSTDLVFEVWLEDSSALTSDKVFVAAGPMDLEDGEACEVKTCGLMGCDPTPEHYCDVAAGQTCSGDPLSEAGPVCADGVAPVLSGVVVRRTGSRAVEVTVSGTDSNWDAAGVILKLTEDGTAITPAWNIQASTPLTGVDQFDVLLKGNLTSGKELASSTLEVTVSDAAFLQSNTITVDIPDLLTEGETCSGDNTVDLCNTGMGCIDGTCQKAAPVVDDAVLTWSTPANALVTISGSDDTKDINGWIVEFNGPGDNYPTTMRKSGSISAFSPVVWSGADFEFANPINSIGAGTITGSTKMRVTISDAGGENDVQIFDIPAQLGFDEVCTVEDRCEGGLACVDDGGTSYCSADPVNPCLSGKTPLTLDTFDTPILVDFATGAAYANAAAEPECLVASGHSNNEVVWRYEATEDGTLSITTGDDASDAVAVSPFVVVREGECAANDAVFACADATTGGNSITEIDVMAGDLLFITIESSYWSTANKGTVTYTFTPATPAE